MRIAILHWVLGKIGGAEVYVDLVASELNRRGHEIGILARDEAPANVEKIEIPAGVPTWVTSRLGVRRALAELRDWHPDLIYSNCFFNDPELDDAPIAMAPSVVFAHAYFGTCIGWNKTFSFPRPVCCDRRFGWQCLLLYYPRRCGGLNPKTMWRSYVFQSRMLAIMRRYQALVVASRHMREEFIKHGFAPETVHQINYPVTVPRDEGEAAAQGKAQDSPRSEWRLLFVGRMSRLKGGGILLDALAKAFDSLKLRLRLTMVGDGPDRGQLEEKATRLTAGNPAIAVDFTGWVSPERVHALMGETDLVIVPSLWPEPFGLVGPEAGLHGVPAAAFAVGGIPEWLTDGVSGHLAPGDHPTADGLAKAILKCLGDPVAYSRLREGARAAARRFTMERHVTALLGVFDSAVDSRRREGECHAGRS